MTHAGPSDRVGAAPCGSVGADYRDDVLPVLLAGGVGSRLHELTDDRCKPAVPFVGEVRIVDFTMQNLVASGFDRVVVATQYCAEPLEAHLRDRWAAALASGGLILRNATTFLPGGAGATGTADAVRVNADVIERFAPRELLVLAADHVYSMDYRPMIAAHRASGADLTVSAVLVPRTEASGFGILDADAAGNVRRFVEKPADPPPSARDGTRSLASMGIYVISWPWLRTLLDEAPEVIDFGHHVVPRAVTRRSCHLHVPEGAEAFFWRDVGTLDALRTAALAFAGETPPIPLPVHDRLRRPRWPGWARAARRANLQDSVLMEGSMVSADALLSNCIVASGCILPSGTVIGVDAAEDSRWFRRTPEGTVLVTPKMLQKRNRERGLSVSGDHEAKPADSAPAAAQE